MISCPETHPTIVFLCNASGDKTGEYLAARSTSNTETIVRLRLDFCV
jgi:hypothetical protein